MDERKLTFGSRRALSIIGSLEARLYKDKDMVDKNSKSLRKQDNLILDAVDGHHSTREVIAKTNLGYDLGLHSIAWLVETGFLYSSDSVKKEIEKQADKLALFVDLFTDSKHGMDFWENEVLSAASDNQELKNNPVRLKWKGITPQISEPLPSPQEIRNYFLLLFVFLYDKAEAIFGPNAVLAKRILLDVHSY